MNDLLIIYYFVYINIINKLHMLCSHLFAILFENETENNLIKLGRFCTNWGVFNQIG